MRRLLTLISNIALRYLRLFITAALGVVFRLRQERTATVALIFAACVIPIMMCIGLAIDYSFYVADESQLDAAADSAALHAVRAASQAQTYGMTYQAAGLAAAQQWFAAAVTPLVNVSITGGYEPLPASNISITYDATTGSFTAAVSYKGLVYTHFSKLFKVATWNIAGTATSTISNSFVEVEMLIDNSSSMLIGATDADITALEYLTECAPTVTAAAAQQPFAGTYSWNLPSGYGYNLNNGALVSTVPTTAISKQGSCYPNFTGPTGECFSPVSPTLTNIQSTGYCPANTGVLSTAPNSHWLPQAPCAFACHTGDGVHDYYTLARAAIPKITLRFDVVQAAAAQVIQTMINLEQVQNQFSVGVFQFNNLVSQVHPVVGLPLAEADANLQQAITDVKGITTPIVSDGANTYFEGAMAYLAANLKPGGTGGTITTPRKNLFIVTDGMDDYQLTGGSRTYGAMTQPANETNCAPLKAMGFTIYVLYTPYTPLANVFYLTTPGVIGAVEPATPDPPAVLALKACASSTNGTPNYYQASSAADINTALQTMLQQALNSPGRITN